MYEWVWICSESECWKVILILKLKSLCEKWEFCFEVRTLVAIQEILAPWWEIEEDRCYCMVSLCHGLIPHNSSLIVIACINMMRVIRIDIQMIAKDKTWILLYKDCVLSHSASLEDKKWIEVEGVDIQWFHGIINTFSLSLVCPKAFLC